MFSRPLLHELYTPGRGIAATPAVPVSMGQFVALTAGAGDVNVTVAAAGSRAFGLAQDNADAGELVGIQRGNARCFNVPTTATITAGQELEVGPNGEPVPHTTGVVVAVALAAAADGHVSITLV